MRTLHSLTRAIVAVATLAGPTPFLQAGQLPSGEIGRPAPAPSVFAPSIMLTDLGLDTNILSSADARSDFTGTVRAQIEPSGQFGPIGLRGRGGIDFAYFQQNADQRSVNGDGILTIDLRGSRFALYATGAGLRTRDSYAPEIDVPVRRVEVSTEGGGELRVSARTRLVGGVRWSQLAFDDSARLFDRNLHETLDRTVSTLTLGVRTAVTPLTAIVALTELQRDRFPLSPLRDTNDTRVLAGLEFRPTALVSGKAHVGYRQLIARDAAQPDVSGVVASVDLTYTLLDAVRFGARVERDLGHSYSEEARYYAFTAVRFSATRRVTRAWDLTATIGRRWMVYPNVIGPSPDADPKDLLWRYGGGVEYRLANTTVGFTGEYWRRTSDISGYGYDRLRVVSSIAYRF